MPSALSETTVFLASAPYANHRFVDAAKVTYVKSTLSGLPIPNWVTCPTLLPVEASLAHIRHIPRQRSQRITSAIAMHGEQILNGLQCSMGKTKLNSVVQHRIHINSCFQIPTWREMCLSIDASGRSIDAFQHPRNSAVLAYPFTGYVPQAGQENAGRERNRSPPLDRSRRYPLLLGWQSRWHWASKSCRRQRVSVVRACGELRNGLGTDAPEGIQCGKVLRSAFRYSRTFR